jgi:hypothetical protein
MTLTSLGHGTDEQPLPTPATPLARDAEIPQVDAPPLRQETATPLYNEYHWKTEDGMP